MESLLNCGHPPRPEVRGFHLTDIIAAIGHRAQRPQEPLYPPLEKEGFSERAPWIKLYAYLLPIFSHDPFEHRTEETLIHFHRISFHQHLKWGYV